MDMVFCRVVKNPEVLSDLIIEVDGVKFALHKVCSHITRVIPVLLMDVAIICTDDKLGLCI
jgi:hypothetical protein